VTAIKDAGVQVSVTHVHTDKTEIFSSFRKAALSIGPKYNTTGSTLKTYAEKGILFKGEYKISIIM